MIKEYADIFRRLIVLVDLCLITLVFFISYWLRTHYLTGLLGFNFYVWLCPLFVFLWGGSLYLLGMYKSFRLKSIDNILWVILNSALIAFILFGAVMYMFKVVDISRSFILLAFGLTTMILAIEKLILVLFFREMRHQGFNFRNILIVGTNKRAHDFIHTIDNLRGVGLKIVGILDEDPKMVGQNIGGHEITGSFDDLADILAHQAIDQAVFIVERSSLEKIEPLMVHCETTGTTVSLAVNLFNLKLTVAKEESILGIPMITFQTVSNKVGQLLIKRILDTIISGVWLLVSWPLYLIVSILIKATSKGPVFFTQERCGLQGRKFKLYKFRTMSIDAESRLEALKDKNEMQGPVFKIKNDPRITPIGKFLRKWSIDEFPQFWNVFCGQMSLIGTRPPIPREVEQYDYWQRRRLSMPPGITGLWQVSGRSDISNFDEWVKLDLQYIDHWSLKEDFRILMQTIPTVLKSTGAR